MPVTLPLTRSEFKLGPTKDWDVTVTAKGEAKFKAAKGDDASSSTAALVESCSTDGIYVGV